ncbi:MAG TPA: glycosyltransferase family 2 protein [Gemmatimonadales bacterium]|nr:glycosyltransferase family 2 protein [Gemmatimonadales bacterium]
MIWLIPAGYLAVLVALTVSYRRRAPRLRDYAPDPGGALLSIIIPARNEAANIERCVRSVLTTTYRPFEIIVVDDRSDDTTGEIVARIAAEPASAGRVRLLRGGELPAEWFGKPWALVQGYREAKGDLLVFTDADTRHEPELISRAVAALKTERADLVSILGRQELGSFWERLIQPHVFLALGARVGSFARVNRTRLPWDAIANGQFILTTRAAYDAVGTHAVVRETVAEDLALAQAFVRARRDIFLIHATEFMATRMYASLGAILEGWSKNLALGTPLMLPPIPWLRRIAPWLIWIPALAWIVPPVVWLLTGGVAWGVASAISLVIWFGICVTEGAPAWYALLYPFGAAMLAFIMLRSAWRGGRRVEWKGRRYRVH